jgi:tRNA(fMet)-specific endonuclease VapC
VKYLLDTSTVSFLMRGEPSVRDRLTSHARTDIFVCQPVIAEIEYGLAPLARSARSTRLRARFDLFLEETGCAAWTEEVSRAFGAIEADLERRRVRLEDFDVAVAAHAVAMGATVVTANVKHMSRVRGLVVENWRRPLSEA